MWKWLRCLFSRRCLWVLKTSKDDEIWLECAVCGRQKRGVPF